MKKFLLVFLTILAINTFANNLKISTAQISLNNPQVDEATVPTNFVLTLSEASNLDTIVNFTVSGSATVGSDYTALPSPFTVTIPAGTTTVTININLVNDWMPEGAETIVLNGTVVSGNTTNTTFTGVMIITDNDDVFLTVNAVTNAIESTTNGLFVFSLPFALTTPTTITYTITGTATNGNDYVSLPISIILPANETTVNLPVIVIDDLFVEGPETVIITVFSTSSPIITTFNTPITLTISDNETANVSIVATTNQASEPSTNGLFTLTISNPATTPTFVSYNISGTATNGADYVAIPTTITIPANALSATLPVSILADTICEGNETVVITLVSTSNSSISVDSTPAIVTINDISSTLAATTAFAGNSATVTATGGFPPYSYSLNNNPFQASNIFSNIVFSNNNTFTVKDTSGCSITNTATGNPCDLNVLINGSLDVPTSTYYLSLVSFSQAPLTGAYTFTIDGGQPLSFDNNFAAVILANTLVIGTHNVMVTNGNGCSVATTFFGGTANISINMIGTYNDFNNDGFVNAGDIMNVQYTVTNLSAVAISNITVTDSFNPQLTISGGPIAILAPNTSDSTTFTGIQVLTQQNINQGFVGTAATATGTIGNAQVSAVNDFGLSLAISRGFKLNAFIDTNNNGVQDGAEINFSGGTFSYQIGTSAPVNVYSNGQFYLYENNPATSYNLSFGLPPSTNICGNSYNVATSAYSNITLTGTGVTTYNFAITQNVCRDLAVFLQTYTGPKPGFANQNRITYRNHGNTTIASGIITFTKDPVFTTLTTNPATTATATGFTYNFTNLLPNESYTIYVNMQVPTIPTVALGQLTTNLVNATLPNGDINTTNNAASLTQDIRASYDPNDKQENHGPQIVYSTFGSNEYLTYKIRFENTGNANAINVKVNDVLDAKLDPTTIKMIDASHNYVLKRVLNNLEWTFDGIGLSPSVPDTQIGHGYVVFQVKPMPGYVVGTIIPNTANIYFDFNPAIVTNTWTTNFVSTLANNSFVFNDLKVYPNPTKNILNVSNNQKIDILQLNNLLGQTIMTQKVNDISAILDLSDLKIGVYFLKIFSNNLEKTVKIVRE